MLQMSTPKILAVSYPSGIKPLICYKCRGSGEVDWRDARLDSGAVTAEAHGVTMARCRLCDGCGMVPAFASSGTEQWQAQHRVPEFATRQADHSKGFFFAFCLTCDNNIKGSGKSETQAWDYSEPYRVEHQCVPLFVQLHD